MTASPSKTRQIFIYFIFPVSVAFAVFALRAYYVQLQPDPMSLAQLRASASTFPGRSALVVGGTSGLGHGVAVRLAQAQFDVTIAGRNREAGKSVLAEMETASASASSATGADGQKPKHRFEVLDASLMKNVKEFTDKYKAEGNKLDVLVVTQGIGSMNGRTETSEGTDVKMALHYYSRMALVQLLLPLLRNSTSPRVLSVLSAGVHSPYSNWNTDPELKTSYSLKNAADAAGFYNDLALDHFARDPLNSNVLFIHEAPGIVSTNIGSDLPYLARKLSQGLLKVFGMSKEDAAEYLCMPLLTPDEKAGKGLLLLGPKNAAAKVTKAHTDEAMEAVWKSTVEVWRRGGIQV